MAGMSWQQVGKRGVAQARTALADRHPEVPKGREEQWLDHGVGHLAVPCEHVAWEPLEDGVFYCEWCETVATAAEVEAFHAARTALVPEGRLRSQPPHGPSEGLGSSEASGTPGPRQDGS